MSLPTLALALAGLLLPSDPAAADVDGVWHTDLEPALDAAREADKELFVYFTGSDWCKYCILLDKEVFGEAYLDQLSERYVLVKLDFPDPQGETYRAMSKDLLRRNYAHKAAFGVNGQPVILIMTPERWVAGRLGYMPGGVPAFERQLGTIESSKEEILGAYATLHGSGDQEPMTLLAAAYRLNNHPFLRAEDRQRIHEIVRDHDPDDSRNVLAFAALDAFIGTHLTTRKPDWDRVEDALDAMVAETPSVERVAEYHAYRAMTAAWQGDDEASDESLEKARAAGMTGRMNQWLQGHLSAAKRSR